MRTPPPSLAGASAILAACMVFTACSGQDSSAKTGAGDSKMGDSAAMAPAAAASPAAMSDANIVALLDAANMADSSLGSEALSMVSGKDAKNFAKMMMGEHHALREKVQKLAKKLNITGQMPADDPFRAAVDGERTSVSTAAKGRIQDSTYIVQEIAIHTAVIGWVNSAEAQAQNPELKELIKSSGPVLKKHLDRAQEIQRKMVM